MPATAPAIALTAAFVAGAQAQQFVQAGRAQVQQVDQGSSSALLVDLDADGDLDLIGTVSGHTAPLHVYENIGGGRFRVDPRFLPIPNESALILSGDFDGDGRTDVLLSGCLVRNRGAAGPVATPSALLRPLATGDFNGDGRSDVVANAGTQLSLWFGSATFTLTQSSVGVAPTVPTCAAVGDLDGDGALDLVLGMNGNELALRNTGNGNLVYMPTWIPGAVADQTLAIATADFDRDGDVDLATHNGAAWLFRSNDGTGRLLPWGSLTILHTVNSVVPPHQAIDLDGDGAVDFVTTGHWWRNELPARGFVFRPLPATPVANFRDAGDVDGDGDKDLLLMGADSNGYGYRLLLDMGGQSYVDATAFPLVGDGLPVAADLDRDGDVDLLCAGGSLHRNRGDGWFDPVVPFGWSSTPYYSRASLCDLDGDGDQDVLAVNLLPGRTLALLNFGGGSFFDISAFFPFPPVAHGYLTAAVAFDVDGNHTQDWVYASSDLRLVRNDGAFGFSNDLGAFPASVENFSCLTVADFDRDGDLDLVAGAQSGLGTTVGLHMFVNDGFGHFADSPSRLSFAPTIWANSVQAFDADGDGDQDLVVGNFGSSSYSNWRHRLLLNDGSGTLVEAARLPSILSYNCVAAADVDQDGDQDLVAECYDGVRLWRNNGRAQFSDAGFITTTGGGLPFFEDLDDDGDLDLVLGTQIFRNRTWDAAAPYLPLTGRAYALDFGGTAIPTGIAMPWVSTARARVPLPPFGTLGIDHQSAIELPWLLIAGGTARYEVVLPNNGSMLGVDLAIQAVLYDGVLPHLSPPIYETISH